MFRKIVWLSLILIFSLMAYEFLFLQNQKFRTQQSSLMLATTTSIDATGLLDMLADEFQKDTGIKLKWVAVGTGQALKLARDGNADVVIVHNQDLEEQFIQEGFGVNRRVIARNYFILVGPESDPARVSEVRDLKEAMNRLKQSGVTFISRGDNSGTHLRELELWARVGGKPSTNYLETGQGMAQTLRVAQEKMGYTLTDTATFYALKNLKGLKPVLENAQELENIYAVIAVNPFKIKHTRYLEAMTFISWLTSPQGQKLIAYFKKEGLQLFEPMADKADEIGMGR